VFAISGADVAQRRRSLLFLPSLTAALRSASMNLNDLRSLYYKRWIAERLDDAMLARARVRLERWEQTGGIHLVSAQKWHELLSGGVEVVREVLNGTDDRSQELRTDAPFAGELPVAERNRLFRQARMDFEEGLGRR
jgi:hypothetical protein